MFKNIFAAALLLLLPLVQAAAIQERQVGTLEVAGDSTIAKRAFTGHGWFYDIGLTACGSFHQNNDFVVALSPGQWADGAHCGKAVAITANGKTATAKVADFCPTCSSGDLDLTRGLHTFFAPLISSPLSITWDFV